MNRKEIGSLISDILRKVLMTKTSKLIIGSLITLVAVATHAADIPGQWRAEFDTQIGLQKYLYTFQLTDGKLTGRASVEVGGQKREVELKDLELTGDTLTFAETFKFQDNEVRIDYTGKVSENEIKLTRKVGDFATEELVAKRVLGAALSAATPTNSAGAERPRRGGGFGGPIVLGPDDKAAFDDPPADIDKKRDSIPHGKLEMIEYESKTVGTTRKMQVYTPPGYSPDKKYPVLYLLHGIGGDETEWQRFAHPDALLDNLIADGKAVPMIIVMPNGRAQPDDRPGPNAMATAPAFGKFDKDLIGDLIPFI